MSPTSTRCCPGHGLPREARSHLPAPPTFEEYWSDIKDLAPKELIEQAKIATGDLWETVTDMTTPQDRHREPCSTTLCCTC
ncbi:MAG: hypothetical protein ACRD1T_06220 [Acidimicrobiia bacterium]